MSTHLIFGAGLIGGFMAGSFAANGLKISVLGREKYRQRFLSTLLLTDYNDNQLSASGIDFYSRASDINQTFDFIWLTVKATGLDQAIEQLAPLLKADTVLISCQNGLGSGQRLQAAFPQHRVLRAIMQSNVAELGEAHLHRGSQGTFEIEQYQVAEQELADLLESPVMPTASIPDFEASAWAKLQLNLANAVNALANIPVREMLGDRAYRKIIAQAMRELIAVTDYKNIHLPKVSTVPMKWVPIILSLPNWMFEIIGRSMLRVDPTVRTSMWWDLHHGRLSEVDYLNGAVVDESAKIGLESPMNQRIVELVHEAEQSDTHQGLAAERFTRGL